MSFTGRELKDAQSYLLIAGHTANGKLKADGENGPCTEAALKEFQQAHNLTVTSQLDDGTWDKMREMPTQLPDDPALILEQAALILWGVGNKDQLIADGEDGEQTAIAREECLIENILEETFYPGMDGGSRRRRGRLARRR